VIPFPSDRTEVRSALVLGATSDIAVATLAELHRRGPVRAVLAARDPDAATAAVAAAAPGLSTEALAWDALEVEGHRPLFERAATTLGAIDVVLCAVGLLGHHAGMSMDPVDVDHMIRTNFAGPAAALAAAGQHLVEQDHGTIVVLSSAAGERVRRSNFVYGSTKAGLDGFYLGLGEALREYGVHVLVIRPGQVRTTTTLEHWKATGAKEAPFTVNAEDVAELAVTSAAKGKDLVWAPGQVRVLMSVLRHIPRPIFRKLPI